MAIVKGLDVGAPGRDDLRNVHLDNECVASSLIPESGRLPQRQSSVASGREAGGE